MSDTENLKKRLFQKTSEGEFFDELINSYELSPKLSQQIIQPAIICMLRQSQSYRLIYSFSTIKKPGFFTFRAVLVIRICSISA